MKNVTVLPNALENDGDPVASSAQPSALSPSTSEFVENLSKDLATELAEVDSHISSILDSDTALVREVGDYVRRSGGKRLRPILTILTARACGYEGPASAQVAAALELVHTATLLHDDVIDKAPLRRGKPTVNAQWGDDVAILIADYLYSNAFNLALLSLSPQVLSLICQVTAKMCEGELFQIEKRDAMLTRDDYLRIVRRKTAYLFSSCSALGSVLADSTEATTEQLGHFGLEFGVAFQITDDTLDLVTSNDKLGKPHWVDIRNGKQTLPLIHAYTTASEADRAELESCWNNGRDAERIMELIAKYGGVEAALTEARNFASEARDRVSVLPPSKWRDALEGLCDYVVQRTH